MQDKSEGKRSIEQLVNIVIGVIGIVAIVIGAALTQNNTIACTVLMSLGTSLLASAVVAFLSSIYIQRYKRAKEISEIWGISSIQEKRTLMNVRIDEEEKKAKHQIDIMAFGLKSLREGNADVIRDCLRRGVQLRIITVDPDNKRLTERDREEKKTEGSTSDSIKQLKKWCEELNEQFPGKVLIRYSNIIPTEFYNRVDDYIYVGPYQYGKESQQTITFEYKAPGRSFDYYSRYFETLWNDKNYCL